MGGRRGKGKKEKNEGGKKKGRGDRGEKDGRNASVSLLFFVLSEETGLTCQRIHFKIEPYQGACIQRINCHCIGW